VLKFTTAHTTSQSVIVITSGCLAMAPNVVDSVFTSLWAADCLIAPHGRNSWPLTLSRVWPPLATPRYRRIAIISNSVGRSLRLLLVSPAQSFLASVSSRSMTKIFVLSSKYRCSEMGPPLRREEGSDFQWR
jgi:hypothetical protein